MIIDCHYCPKELDTLKDDVLFTNSAYGTNHPTCEYCYENHKDTEQIEDYPINTKTLSKNFCDFINHLNVKNFSLQ